MTLCLIGRLLYGHHHSISSFQCINYGHGYYKIWVPYYTIYNCNTTKIHIKITSLIQMEPYHGMTTKAVADSLDIQSGDVQDALRNPHVLHLRQRLYTKVTAGDKVLLDCTPWART